MRNFLKQASCLQFKRDWQRIEICVRLRELGMEGVEIGEKHEREFAKIEHRTKWENYRHSRIVHKKLLKQVENALRAVKEDRLKDHMGFGVEIRESELPAYDRSFKHNKGLFAKDKIPVGTVVTLVPGMVWQGINKYAREWTHDSEGNPNRASPYIHFGRLEIENAIVDADLERYGDMFGPNADDVTLRRAETEYALLLNKFMRRYNDKVGNALERMIKKYWLPIIRHIRFRLNPARGQMPYLPPKEWAKRNAFQPLMGLRCDHDFARGHYINHIGVHGDPNVMFVPISIPVVMPVDLYPYLPYKTDPAVRGLGDSDYIAQIIASEKRDTLFGFSVISNHLLWGDWYRGPQTAYETEFLLLIPALAVLSLRDIAPGEELLANHRFSPHPSVQAQYPSWYQPVPHLQNEDCFNSNIDAPGTSLLYKMLFGCVDPVSLSDILKEPRHIGYTPLLILARFLTGRRY
eukprot:TRINITY_DN16821_c0_g3_i1.p1 TRINITY_DN16821_c0_g3~~TRINITY_DN16821_c0_g3_i1.p1  ORF type:complete len:519 (+),score=79.37 TRINITY_DN16821_c0_g3_i1:170-1558(+)